MHILAKYQRTLQRAPINYLSILEKEEIMRSIPVRETWKIPVSFITVMDYFYTVLFSFCWLLSTNHLLDLHISISNLYYISIAHCLIRGEISQIRTTTCFQIITNSFFHNLIRLPLYLITICSIDISSGKENWKTIEHFHLPSATYLLS